MTSVIHYIVTVSTSLGCAYKWIYGSKHSKMDKGAKDKLAGSPGDNGGG